MRYKKVSFDDWVAKTPNQIEVKQSAIKAAGENKNIIMVGNCGTGKTMLSHCITNSFKTGIVATASKIGRVFRDNMNHNKVPEQEIIDALTKDCEYLIIDEIGVYQLTDYEYRMINEIIDIRYNLVLPTGLVTNLDLKGLKSVIGERVIDRLKGDGGMLAPFTWNSLRK